MFRTTSFIRLCILSIFLFLPVAQFKVIILGIPLYGVEAPVLLALFAYAYGRWRGIFPPAGKINFRSPVAIGIALFSLGAVFSSLANPFSLTGLGMIKTWFAFPLLALFLWLETRPGRRELEQALLVWLGVATAAASASLMFLLRGELTYDGRLQGWYASPNYLAFFVAPGIPVAVYFLSRLMREKRTLLSLLPSMALASLVSALFFTRSYGVWLSVFAALALFFLLGWVRQSSRRTIIPILLFASVASLFIFFESGSEKWQTLTTRDERSSLASRMMIWQAAGKMIADHPVWGIGMGRFQDVYLSYQEYFPPYLEWAVPEPHNLALALWLNTGLIGLIGFLVLALAWLRRLYAFLRSSAGDGPDKPVAALLFGLLALCLSGGLFDTPFFKTDLAFIFWLLLAFTLGLLDKQKSAS